MIYKTSSNFDETKMKMKNIILKNGNFNNF